MCILQSLTCIHNTYSTGFIHVLLCLTAFWCVFSVFAVILDLLCVTCTLGTCPEPQSSPFLAPLLALKVSLRDAFSELNTLIQQNRLSSCVGWVISLGETLNDHASIEDIKEELNDMPSPRIKNGWALILHLTQQVKHSFT